MFNGAQGPLTQQDVAAAKGGGAAPGLTQPATPADAFQPAANEQEGQAAVMKEIPDLSAQMPSFLQRARGDDAMQMRGAIASGDHQGVQYLLDKAAYEDPNADHDGPPPTAPEHWGHDAASIQQPAAPAQTDDTASVP
jgi:hypothetical protein